MIIGLSGYARSGKDSVAAVLVKDHGFVRVAFADALRDLALAADPIVHVNWHGRHEGRISEGVEAYGWDDLKQEYPEVRLFLQRLGVGVREVLGPDTWVRIAMAKAKNELAKGPVRGVVITDCRFPNEAEAIEAAGGKVVRVERPGTAPVNGHQSETALDAWPFALIFPNNSSLEALASRIPSMLAKLGVVPEDLPARPPSAGSVLDDIARLGVAQKQEVARGLAKLLAAELRVSA